MSKSAIFLRFTNGTLLAVITLLTFTGLYGLVWPMPGWMFDIHRIAAWAVVGLLPWKGLIIVRSLKRGLDKRFIRSVVVVISLVLAIWTLLVFGLALFWVWTPGLERTWLYQTTLSWHWYLALGLLLPFIFHVWQKWPRPRPTDFTSRREVLKLIGVGVAAVALWGVSEVITAFREDPEQPRRPSGSKETNSLEGMTYPVNMMVGEGKTQIDPATWRFSVKGAVEKPLTLSYDEMLSQATAEVTATLDCTDGWYTTQVWQGVRLTDLFTQAKIKPDAKGFVLRAVSGYAGYFTVGEAEEILLSTHVGGQRFDHWHGFPLRAVVPSRRGWQWVKWLVEVEVL
jgi:hypothetical protein